MKTKLTISALLGFLLGASLMFVIMYDFEQPKEVIKIQLRDTCDHSECMAKVKGCFEYKQVTN